MFVEFEIIGGNAGWMKAENAWIQTAGYAFRRAAAGNFSDLKRNLVKLKTLSTGVRIFNGAVRTEREFPLKILFLACIQGFVVLLILRNRDQNLPSRFPNTISVYSVSKYFRTFIQPHATDKSKSVSLYFSPHMLYAEYDALFHFPALPDILHTISLSKDFHGIFSGS